MYNWESFSQGEENVFLSSRDRLEVKVDEDMERCVYKEYHT